ncbi:MAG: S8 family serine peptidase [Verrucomicrobia bacterium]|nr:S8 family serine peptidase [Verrucomicrobiota bacterium]
MSKGDALTWITQRLGLPPGAELREPHINSLLKPSDIKLELLSVPIDLERFLYLRLPSGFSVEKCLERLRGHPLVEYAEPDSIGDPNLLPADERLENYHYWEVYPLPATNGPLHTPEAWDITTGSTNVTVAVLDSGIDARLLEFAGRLVPGYNFVANSTDTHDTMGHGTGVASVLGANANNPDPNDPKVKGIGGVGVDWNCGLMPIKVINDDSIVLDSWAAQGVDYAVSRGAKVILFSASTRQNTVEAGQTLSRAIDDAIRQGVLFVCSAGNSGTLISGFPARYKPAITVGSTSPSGSSFGPELDVVAPTAGNVLRPRDDRPQYGDYGGVVGGTSGAAAMVAGVCSLLASLRPDITQEQALLLLAAAAEDQGGDFRDTRGFDIYFGWGRVNAYNTLVLAQTQIEDFHRLPENRVEMSWRSTPNALQKEPYQVEFTPSLSQPWAPLTNGLFKYETTLVMTNGVFASESHRAFWTGPAPVVDPASPQGYYRVRIKLNEAP